MANELYHHGIKGQKWGVRRFQNKNGTLTNAGKKRYSDSSESTEKEALSQKNRHARSAKSLQRDVEDLRKHGYRSEADAVQKVADREKAKAVEKYNKDRSVANKVKTYNKKYDEWNKAQESADAKWAEVQEKRAKMGKNAISRILASAKNKTAEAKDYNRAYEDWNKAQEKADAKWNATQAAYAETGRNAISRIFNNIKYRP